MLEFLHKHFRQATLIYESLHGMTAYSQIGMFHWNPNYLDRWIGMDLLSALFYGVGQNHFHDFNILLETKRRRCGVDKSTYVLLLFFLSQTINRRSIVLALSENFHCHAFVKCCFSETGDSAFELAWITSKFLMTGRKVVLQDASAWSNSPGCIHTYKRSH